MASTRRTTVSKSAKKKSASKLTAKSRNGAAAKSASRTGGKKKVTSRQAIAISARNARSGAGKSLGLMR